MWCSLTCDEIWLPSPEKSLGELSNSMLLLSKRIKHCSPGRHDPWYNLEVFCTWFNGYEHASFQCPVLSRVKATHPFCEGQSSLVGIPLGGLQLETIIGITLYLECFRLPSFPSLLVDAFAVTNQSYMVCPPQLSCLTDTSCCHI